MNGITVFIAIVCAVACGFLAAQKGRNIAGWVVCGFILGLIGLVVLLCLPNLKEERQYREFIAMKNRRLSEQLRQEQLKGEALRRHAVARLDAHDNVLGIDTRQTTALPAPATALEELSNSLSGAGALPPTGADSSVVDSLARMAGGTADAQPVANGQPAATPADIAAVQPATLDSTPRTPGEITGGKPPLPPGASQQQAAWYYESNGQSRGPVQARAIHAMLQMGTLTADTLLWSEMLTEWTPAGLVPQFTRAFQA